MCKHATDGDLKVTLPASSRVRARPRPLLSEAPHETQMHIIKACLNLVVGRSDDLTATALEEQRHDRFARCTH